MKTIVYLHGYASSSQSGTAKYLAKKMKECNVVAPDIPIDPVEALPFIKNYCAQNHADLIIGTSMGGMYAMQLTDYPRICVNPALHMSQLTDVLMVGTFERFQPMFDDINSENQSLCWGFFADGDTLVNCKEEFAQHFTQVADFHGEHRMNNAVIRDVIIPAAKRILTK